ncbi:MAG: hypothetical protein ACFFDX_16745, partial [Candidatus Odinarchaeota archaeon]
KKSFLERFEKRREFLIEDIQILKKIVIKSPKLQLIRNNLRTLFFLYAEAEYFRLSNLSKIYLSKSELTNSQARRFEEIREMRYKLYWSLTHSICSCAICDSKTKDMGYITSGKCWVCFDCIKNIISKS